VEPREPRLLNRSACKHTKHDGLCKKCSEDKPYTVFKYCEVKSCPKDATCQHAGYFWGSGNEKENGQKKPEYPKSDRKDTHIENVEDIRHHHSDPATPINERSLRALSVNNPAISEYLLNLLTVLGRNDIIPPLRKNKEGILVAPVIDPSIRSNLIYDGWELLKCLRSK
jgi:hypothetical protein